MDAEEKLFGLMAIAEEQQGSVAAAVKVLADERAQCAKERQALARMLQEIGKVASAAPSIVERAVRDALTKSLDQTVNARSTELQRAFAAATKPAINELASIVERTSAIEEGLRRALAWVSWRWLGVIAGLGAGAMFVIWIASITTVAWQNYQVTSLMHERADLEADIVRLTANVEALEKRGGRVALTYCGDQRRLCVQVKKDLQYGKDGDYFVLRGY